MTVHPAISCSLNRGRILACRAVPRQAPRCSVDSDPPTEKVWAWQELEASTGRNKPANGSTNDALGLLRLTARSFKDRVLSTPG